MRAVIGSPDTARLFVLPSDRSLPFLSFHQTVETHEPARTAKTATAARHSNLLFDLFHIDCVPAKTAWLVLFRSLVQLPTRPIPFQRRAWDSLRSRALTLFANIHIQPLLQLGQSDFCIAARFFDPLSTTRSFPPFLSPPALPRLFPYLARPESLIPRFAILPSGSYNRPSHMDVGR
jgi:hypothetical protein